MIMYLYWDLLVINYYVFVFINNLILLNVFKNNLFFLYILYRSEIAKQLKNKCYALVLCFNSLVSLLLLLCYKEICVRGNIFKIDIPQQVSTFEIYNFYVFLIRFYLNKIRHFLISIIFYEIIYYTIHLLLFFLTLL